MKRRGWSKLAQVPGDCSAIGSEAGWSIATAAWPRALLLGVAALLLSAPAWAQQRIRHDDSEGGLCESEAVVVTDLKTTGAYLPGVTIGIQADPPRIRVQTPKSGNPRICTVRSVPISNWNWQLIARPPLSTSQLAGTAGLAVSLLLDQAGDYKIRFTVCPSGCEIKSPHQTTVAAQSRELVVRVLAMLPPEKLPVLPPSALKAKSPTNVSAHCPFGGDILNAAWRTVKPWNGAGDYKLLEGRVLNSKVAQADCGFNHYSQDWNIYVAPDPKHRALLNANHAGGQREVEVEWERDYLPEMYRPTEGDRVSAIGYWVYDCGHGAPTEIHPPVLLAVHRARALALPNASGFGSNAYVPGIVTDIWVNREAGNTTDDCPGTGLHQQKHPSKPPTDALGRPLSRCLPDSEGFSSNPINSIFEFNIYLPRSPHAVMAAVGRTVPPVPLYSTVSNPSGSGGPEPVVEEITEGNVTYLRVRIDLSAYTEQTYSRRIVAAWAHAAPDNWGARRWNVRITSLDITDDADSKFRGDGDWRFWVNTNNGAKEWAKLFDCDGCAHGSETFGGRPWETNSAFVGRSLGASIVLFPNQLIWLATSGFEEDWTLEDSIAPLYLHLPQVQVTDGKATASDGDGKYTMHYQVLPGEEVGQALLSPAAKARYDAYSLTNNDLHGLHSNTLALLDASFNAGTGRQGRPTVRPAEKRQREPTSIEEMSVRQIRQTLQRAQRENPAQLEVFFRDLNRFVQRGKNAHREEEVHQFLKELKPAVPAVLWRKHGLEGQMRALRKTE